MYIAHCLSQLSLFISHSHKISLIHYHLHLLYQHLATVRKWRGLSHAFFYSLLIQRKRSPNKMKFTFIYLFQQQEKDSSRKFNLWFFLFHFLKQMKGLLCLSSDGNLNHYFFIIIVLVPHHLSNKQFSINQSF